MTMTQMSYDLRGRLQCSAQRLNPQTFSSSQVDACLLGTEGVFGPDRISRTTYDAVGRVKNIRKAVGTPDEQIYVAYEYNNSDSKTSIVDANGNRSALVYDGFKRITQWYFPSKTKTGATDSNDFESYTYDANGNLTALRRRDGRTLTFGYDALNRMTSKIVPDGCAPMQVGSCTPADATRDVYYGYDLQGHQTYARYDTDAGEGVSNTYDALGRLTSSTVALGGYSRTLGFQHDAHDNRTRLTYPDGVAFDQNYDGLDRAMLTWQPGGVVIANAVWNTQGLLKSLSKVNAVTYYGYDGIGRLDSQNQALASGGVKVTLGYNPASQITSKARDNDAYTFTGRYNVERRYGVNGQNQYTNAGATSFQYDANGNLISDGTNSYVYDAENRLVSASNGANLRYDPLGRLWQVSGNAGTTQFLYDGDQLTAEYDGSGNMLRRYVHGTAVDDPLVWYEGAGLGDRRSLMADHQGSIVAIADGNGNPVQINTYDEYGIPGAGNIGRFQYTGQAFLAELGMYHYKARLYSPTLGRFLQTDPIGYDDQINLYAYVANDPVNGRDPSGRQSCDSKSTTCLPTDGGPLKGNVDPSKLPQLTDPSSARQQFQVQAAGGYYVNDGKSLTWHSGSVDAALQLGKLSLGALGGELLGPAIAGIRGLSAANESTALFRAVNGAELGSIKSLGGFSNPAGIESKYFSTTLGGAQSYASQAAKAFGDGPFSIVRTSISSSSITPNMMVTVDRGINTVVIPTSMLPGLSKPVVLP